MSCCPPGSWPALEEQPAETLGKEEDLGQGVHAYVVRPPQDKKNGYGIISIPEIYKFNGGRVKGFMDQFALAGYTVVHIDVAGDDVFPTDGTSDFDKFKGWVNKYTYPSVLKPKIQDTIIPFLKGEGVSKIATFGFCWGSHIVIQMAADADLTTGTPSLAVGAMFHPSLQVNGFLGGHPEALDIAEKVTVPLLVVPAGNDPPFVGPDGSVLTTLKASSTRAKESKSVVFPDMQHGYTTRGDASIPEVKRDVQATIELALEFFQEKLA
jgi:dienelactone hydrolase